MKTTRRTAMKQAAGVGAGFLGANFLAACGSSGGGSTATTAASSTRSTNLASSLNVLCWEGYTDPGFTKTFEHRTGCKVNSTFIGSNDELIAKLRGAPGQYDLVTPSSDTTNLLIDAKQVQPINLDNVPNAKTAFPFFRNAPNVNVGGKLYGIPMAWGFIPLIYDKDAVKTAPTSWNALWDPQYTGKVSMWQDISLIWTTALLLGFKDPYNLSDAQLKQVRTKLVAQKPLVRKYWTTAGELTNLFANKEVVIGQSFGGLTVSQLRDQGRNVAEVIPKEGATSWFDNWMVTASSKKVSTVEAWLNHIQDAKTQLAIAKSTGYGITNTNAIKLVPKSYAAAYHLSDLSFISRLNYWKRVPRRQKYLDVLNSVISA